MYQQILLAVALAKGAGAQIREVNERVEDLKACFARLQVEVDAVLPLGTALLPVKIAPYL